MLHQPVELTANPDILHGVDPAALVRRPLGERNAAGAVLGRVELMRIGVRRRRYRSCAADEVLALGPQ
jgi:hypothetical protein